MNAVEAQFTGKNLQYGTRRHEIPSRMRKERVMPIRTKMIPVGSRPSDNSDRVQLK